MIEEAIRVHVIQRQTGERMQLFAKTRLILEDKKMEHYSDSTSQILLLFIFIDRYIAVGRKRGVSENAFSQRIQTTF